MKKTAEQLAKIAAIARKNFVLSQQKAVKESIPVAHAAELFVPTSAGATRILIYRSCTADVLAPVFFNMHGGGFIMGSPEDDDVWCRKIVNAVDCVVVSIDYHLAPEFKFPAALEECCEVILWAIHNSQDLAINPAMLAVGGQSAGGNLAASLCLLARQRRQFSILFQFLNYPPLDMTINPYNKPAGDKILTARMQELFNDCYFRCEEDRVNPLVSPLLAETLTGLPDALIITAEHDPLRPEAEQYARRLAAAGVHAYCRSFENCMHAFTHYGPPSAADAAARLVHSSLRKAFGQTSAS